MGSARGCPGSKTCFTCLTCISPVKLEGVNSLVTLERCELSPLNLHEGMNLGGKTLGGRGARQAAVNPPDHPGGPSIFCYYYCYYIVVVVYHRSTGDDVLLISVDIGTYMRLDLLLGSAKGCPGSTCISLSGWKGLLNPGV